MSGKKKHKRNSEGLPPSSLSRSPSPSRPPSSDDLLPPSSANRPVREAASVGAAKRAAGGSYQKLRHSKTSSEPSSSSSSAVYFPPFPSSSPAASSQSQAMSDDGEEYEGSHSGGSPPPSVSTDSALRAELSEMKAQMAMLTTLLGRERSITTLPHSSSILASSSPLPSTGKNAQHHITPEHSGQSISVTSSPTSTGGSVNVNITSPPPLSVDGLRALSHLTTNPSLADITSRMAASSKQRTDAAAFSYVPLAYFSPIKSARGGPSYHSASSSSPGSPSVLSAVTAILQSTDSVAQAERERIAIQSVPHFTSWEEVITAFSAGLMPIVCRGNPDRLLDYVSLLLTLISEHAKGKRHWPVFLRYIETLRKRALLFGSPSDDAEVEDQRAKHRLTTLTSSNAITLDKELLHEIVELWTEKSKLFADDFIDPSTLSFLFHESTPVERAATERHLPPTYPQYTSPSPYSFPTPYPTQQHHPLGGVPMSHYSSPYSPNTAQYTVNAVTSSSSPSPHSLPKKDRKASNLAVSASLVIPGITQEIIAKIKALQPPNNACFMHLLKRCQPNCPNGRPHLSYDKVTQLLAETK